MFIKRLMIAFCVISAMLVNTFSSCKKPKVTPTPVDTTAVDMQTAAILEAEGNNTNDVTAANQSNPFQVSETQIIKRAKVNNIASQQPMTTDLQAEQENMQEDMQAQQAAMQNSDEAMQQQDLQQAMLDEEAALQEETLLESE